MRNKVCADIALFDRKLLKRTVEFYTTVGEFLTSVLMKETVVDCSTITLPTAISNAFAALPEWFVEDIAEFLLFTLQYVSLCYCISLL